MGLLIVKTDSVFKTERIKTIGGRSFGSIENRQLLIVRITKSGDSL
jgi:hypothetical protein